jgi:uncharacterized protein (TIGR02996 family)
MTHEDVFLQDILESRDDDTPRRIYADWLLDHDDPVTAARGEFIHIQCELARISEAARNSREDASSPVTPPTERAADLAKRERQLLEAHAREWGSLFQRFGCKCWEYRRGFVEGVGMPASAFLSHGGALFRCAPIRELKLYQAASVLPDLCVSPLLARVQILDLENNDLSDGDLEALAASRHLGELAALLLWCNRGSDVAVRALIAGQLPRLTRLDLSGNTVGDAGAEALAASLLLKQLLMLDLTANQIGDAGALALANSPHAANLAWLELAKNPISQNAQTLLRERLAGRVHVWG